MYASRLGYIYRVILAVLLATLLALSLSLPSHAQDGDDPAPPRATAQPVRFEHLSMEQGLSNDIVWSILQDSRGLMWFGTIDGLNRYDGYEAKIYRHDPEDPNSLSTNPLRVVYEDRAGDLWIGTTGAGLNRFDRETELFTRYQHDPDDPHSLSSNDVRSIYEDQAGALWIGTTAGLNRLVLSDSEGPDPEAESAQAARFTHFKHDPDDPHSLSHSFVQSVIQDHEGMIWVGTWGGGLDRLDPQTGRFTHHLHDPDDPSSLSNNFVWVVVEDEMGTLWAGTNGGLNMLETQSGPGPRPRFVRFQHDPDDPFSLSDNTIRSIYGVQAGNLWVGTFGGGLNWFDSTEGTFVRYQYNPTAAHSLGDNDVTSIQEDRVGTLWIGTGGGGISIIDANRKPFAHFQHIPSIPHSLSSKAVRSIHEDRSGTLWIGTQEGGLNRYDPNRGTFAHFRHDPDDPHSLSGVFVWSIAEDPEGILWIGTETGGLNRLDPQSVSEPGRGHFDHYRRDPADPRSISSNSIRSVLVDRSGDIWLGTRGNGLDRFDPESETFTHYVHDPNDADSLSNNAVRVLYQDSEGSLWIGTISGGLDRFDPATEKFVHFQHDPSDPSSLSDNSVRAILEDDVGNLWIGTWGGGLNRLDRANGTFERYTEKDGLANNVIWGILEDNVPPEGGGSSLWISTNQGLSRFNLETETFRNYDASDGLQSNSFYSAYYAGSYGLLYFGGANGFNAFNPAELQDNTHPPPVVLVDFQLNNSPVPIGGESVLRKSSVETDELVLSYEDRVITFMFAALNYSSPEKNRYRYMLDDFDDSWIEVGSDQRRATYTNLDPDEYVFRVIGSNNDGIWNEEGLTVRLTVTPPWWATWRFRGGMLLLLVGLVAGGFVWQRDSARRRERHLEAVVTERNHDLDERVKELDCLYGISKLAGQQGLSLEQIIGEAVDLLPPAMESPEIACARIVFDGHKVKTDNFQKTPWQQSSTIIVRGEQAGQVEVAYLEERPEAEKGPFQREERLLLEAVAGRLGRIAERKQAEEALQESEEKYRDLVEKVSDVIYSVDAGGAITYLNPAIEELIGLPAEQVVGQPFAQLIHPEDLGRLQENVQNLSSGGAPGTAEYRVLNISGETRWIRVTSQPIMDGGQLTGLQGVLTDITERKRMEAQLEAEAMAAERQRLARDLHDSVTQTLFSANVIAEATPLVWQKDPEIGQRNLEQLHRLTRGALAEMRTLLLELRPAALQDQKLRELLETLAEAAQIRIRAPVVVKAEGDCVIPDDVAIAFYRVAQEALNNVAKHAEATQVQVSLVCEPGKVVLRIRDDGRGFDPGATPQGRLGIGIMEERAMEIGADLLIDGEPGSGTEILVAWADSSKRDKHD